MVTLRHDEPHSNRRRRHDAGGGSLFETPPLTMTDEQYTEMVVNSRALAVYKARKWAPDVDPDDAAQETMMALLRLSRCRNAPVPFSCVFNLRVKSVIWHMRRHRKTVHRWGGRPMSDFREGLAVLARAC